MELYLHHREKLTTVLGPGRRYAIWVQGCLKRCKGCINPEGQPIDRNGYWFSVEDLVKEIVSQENLTGITISGGEPFLQADKLAELIRLLKLDCKQRKPLDIMVYSGYTLDYLRDKRDKDTDYILDNIDILVDGEYIDELNHNSLWRGSDNQHFCFLSKKYKGFAEKMYQNKNRSVEFILCNNSEPFIIGIPEKGFDEKFLQAVTKFKLKE